MRRTLWTLVARLSAWVTGEASPSVRVLDAREAARRDLDRQLYRHHLNTLAEGREASPRTDMEGR